MRIPTREFKTCAAWAQAEVEAASGPLTLGQLRDRADRDCIDCGVRHNYLLRALQQAVARGVMVQPRRGCYATAAPAAPAAPAAVSVCGFGSLDAPTLDPTFRWGQHAQHIPAAATRLRRGEHVSYMAVGPAGSGKTEAGLQMAAHLQIPAVVVDCSLLRDPNDLFGQRTLLDGSVAWRDSEFTRRVTAGHALVLLDELNRATAAAMNALLPLLDRRGAAQCELRGEPIRCGPSIVWWASCNEGRAYVGAGAVDRAVADRFPRRLEFTYLPEADEASLLVERTGIASQDAHRLVRVAASTRTGASARFSLSTRHLIAAAEDLRDIGVGSLASTLAAHFSAHGGAESERATIAQVIAAQWPVAEVAS